MPVSRSRTYCPNPNPNPNPNLQPQPGESLAYLLSTADGGLDVSRLYALAMDAHGADDLAGRVRDKADSIKQRMRERREYADML